MSCPLHYVANAISHWWIIRPLVKVLRVVRRLIGEEDVRRSAVNALGLKPGERVLDMCSGLGDDLRLLVGRDLELYAADACSKYAEATRLEIRDNNWHNIRAIHWTDGRLPFPNASFDAVIVTYGMTNTNNPGCVIAECNRLLKPGGRIVVVDFVTPNKENGIISGLLWPISFLMGCNPYTPWRRQFARAFEVCKQQGFWADLATLTYGRKRLDEVSPIANESAAPTATPAAEAPETVVAPAAEAPATPEQQSAKDKHNKNYRKKR